MDGWMDGWMCGLGEIHGGIDEHGSTSVVHDIEVDIVRTLVFRVESDINL